MKHPAPVLALLRMQRKELRIANQDVRDARVCIANLRKELLVQTIRVERWRRTALELAPKVSPRAMAVCLMQMQSDEIADLDEVAG